MHMGLLEGAAGAFVEDPDQIHQGVTVDHLLAQSGSVPLLDLDQLTTLNKP
jgi:hypothetical protein